MTESSLQQAAKAYAKAQLAREQARDRLAAAVRLAVAEGMTEVDAAAIAGVNRMTIRAWLGK